MPTINLSIYLTDKEYNIYWKKKYQAQKAAKEAFYKEVGRKCDS